MGATFSKILCSSYSWVRKQFDKESITSVSEGSGNSHTNKVLNALTLQERSTSRITSCASLPDPPPSSSEYFSTRIQAMMAIRKNESGSNLEAEIEASKDHWSTLRSDSDEENDEEDFNAEENLELFQRLQKKWPHGFFKSWNDEVFALGEKLGEGAQGKIFKLRFLKPEHAHMNEVYVLKVFNKGCCLKDLEMQWPQGMLDKANAIKKSYYMCWGCTVQGAMLLKDGRFSFRMTQYWGDLRKLIDVKMVQNLNQAAPFVDDTTCVIMFLIARAMRALHKDGILHRDLKASNVLIASANEDAPLYDCDPTTDEVLKFFTVVADYECSLGVVGTEFWRAPEILLGAKNHDLQPSLFSEKSDIYSYGMTCYEVLTGKTPFDDIRKNNYDHVLQGAKLELPRDTKPWIKCLLSRCWELDPANRPSFEEIVEGFEATRLWGIPIM